MPTSTQKAKKGMDQHDILACIKKKKSSYAKIAIALDVHQTSVRSVAIGKGESHRIATHIAKLIGKPIDDIWPGRYNYQPRDSYKDRCENARAVA
ncbi:MAG: hypothetical protein GQ532_09905 [Methylomarinum sp.]|nr:hypothetical protein [Methylomarinum sp.]